MASMNRVFILGRLGKDPEVHYGQNGNALASLSVATDESYTDSEGNKQERTEWHKIVVYQRMAENCATYLRKGSQVLVEGSLQTRKWQDQQGQDRYSTEIKAARIQFLDGRNGNSEDAPEKRAGNSSRGYQGKPSNQNGYKGGQQGRMNQKSRDYASGDVPF